jgi:POT family proton-dependent oligopeptide transporter
MVTKLSPAKLMSLMMGIWLTSSFIGNILGGYFAKFSTSWTLTTFFTVPGVILIVFALLVWLFSGRIRQWMHGVN